MSRRPYLSRFVCGADGCMDFVNYEANTRADQARLYQAYGQGRYRCSRHSRPDEVLSAERPIIVHEQVSYEESYGRFWRHCRSGFTYGPGFRAFAKDFPPGTCLRITAEVILPERATPTSNDTEKGGTEAIADCEADSNPATVVSAPGHGAT